MCSNQIKFCLKSNKLYLWTYINPLIFLFLTTIYLLLTKIYWAQRYFVLIKQILFNLNKYFVWIKKSLLNKLFSFIQSNLFSQCMAKNAELNFIPISTLLCIINFLQVLPMIIINWNQNFHNSKAFFIKKKRY